MFKKTGAWLRRFWEELRRSLPVTAVMAALWLALGWLRSFGVHSAMLAPLHFLTGALAGLDGGSLLGGTIGRMLLLVLVNSFVRELLQRRGSLRQRAKIGLQSLWAALLRKIPQYGNLRQLITGERWRVTINGMGFGMALMGYAFFTGNGSFENSFVCLLLFAKFGGTLVSRRGLIITAANRLLVLLGFRVVDRDLVNRLVGGNALGFAAATAWAAVFDRAGHALQLGGAILLVSAVAMFLCRLRAKKEVRA